MTQSLETIRVYKTSERRRYTNRMGEERRKTPEYIEKKRQRMKNWRKNNPLKIKATKLRWNILNAEKNKLYAKRKREKHVERIKKQKHDEYIRHREQYANRNKQYYLENCESIKKYVNQWQRDNADKILESQKKQFAKYGTIFNITGSKFHYGLKAWSDIVMDRDNGKCQICGQEAEASHHIFYKSKYPKLALNVNNGIALRLKHHWEIHSVVH